jgi:threonine dehydrogenase-like Zn-dependent dehydrogenase
MCANKYVIGVRADVPAAFSDYFLAPAVNVVPLTGGATAELGALVEPLSVGLHAAVRGQIEGGAAVLVIGGGPIGQAAALGALARGGRVLVTEPNVARRALLGRLGVPALDPADGADAIRAALGGPADVVIDAVGSSATIAAAVDASDPLARIVLVGMQTPQLEIAAYAFSTMERTLIGSFSYSASEFAATAAYVGAHPELGQLVEARVGWSGAAEAFRQLAAGEAQASKILVMPDLP